MARVAVTFAVAVVVLAAFAGAAEATAWTVRTTSDAPTGSCTSPALTCSLRQIINWINANQFRDDTITVPAGAYTLSQGALVITQSVSIAGAGARSTVVAAPVPADRSSGGDRVFDIQVGGGVTPTVSISGLEVTGGTANPTNGSFGGDIRNAATLTLTDDWITNGSAYSGGGVSNAAGSLRIERTLVSGNRAPFGGGDSGGIQNWGCPTSTCTTNTTDHPGSLVVDNSTVTGNDAHGVGGIFSWGDDNNTLTISNSTIAGNKTTDEPGRPPTGDAGGLAVATGTEVVQNTIIAGNVNITGGVTTPANCGPFLPSGGFVSLGHNLDSGADCRLSAPTDVSNADPLLGPLQNNGGPTDTLALAANSPAVDRVPASGAGCPPTDQRGVPRPQGAGCDIGAFELAAPAHCSDVSAQTPAGGGVISISLSCRGPAALTYAIVSSPSHGTLAAINQTNGSVNYTPLPGFHGTDRFTYNAVGAGGTSNTATATITVPPAPPICANATLTLRPGRGPASIALRCTAPTGVAIKYGIVRGPLHGTLGSVNRSPGTVRYRPRPNFTGTDRFKFNAMDSGGTSGTTTVTIVILAFPRLNPVVTSDFRWFHSYTIVRSLVASGVTRHASVRVTCTNGCGFRTHTSRPPKSRRVCNGKGKKHHCRTVSPPRLRAVDLTSLFGARHLPIGAQLTVSIVAPNTIGKVYTFKVRTGQQPKVKVTCLAPGQRKPGKGC